MRKGSGKRAAIVLSMAAVLITSQPVCAQESASTDSTTGITWETEKIKILEAMDYLADHGFSPMKIVEKIFGTGTSDTSGTSDTAAEETSVVSSSESSTTSEDAGSASTDSLVESIQQTGEETVQGIKDDAANAAKDTADQAVDDAADSAKSSLHDWIDSLFD